MCRICDYTRLLKWVKWVKYGGGAIDHPRRTIALSIPRQEPFKRFHVKNAVVHCFDFLFSLHLVVLLVKGEMGVQ